MNFQINAKLALELRPDLACQTPDPDKRTDRRVELAAQFIPARAFSIWAKVRRYRRFCRTDAATAASIVRSRHSSAT
jgi:hypothetical protein